MFKLRADVKCYMCGRMAGELSRLVSSKGQHAEFRLLSADESLPAKAWRRTRCACCGCGLFLDEVEKIYLVSSRPLRPEKRGRKPKRRVAVAI